MCACARMALCHGNSSHWLPGRRDGVMDAIERFLLIIASDDVTHAIDYKKLDAVRSKC